MSLFTEGLSPELQAKLEEATTKYGLDRPFEIDGQKFLVAHCDTPASRISRLLLEGFAGMLPGLGAFGRCIIDTVHNLEPLLNLDFTRPTLPPYFNKAWKYNRRYQRLASTTWHYRTRKWTPEQGYHWVYPERRRRYDVDEY